MRAKSNFCIIVCFSFCYHIDEYACVCHPSAAAFFCIIGRKRDSCLFFGELTNQFFLKRGSRSCIILRFSDKCKIIVVGQLRVTISCSSCVYVCLRNKTFLQFHFESLSLFGSHLLLSSLCPCCLCFVVSVHYFEEKNKSTKLVGSPWKNGCACYFMDTTKSEVQVVRTWWSIVEVTGTKSRGLFWPFRSLFDPF